MVEGLMKVYQKNRQKLPTEPTLFGVSLRDALADWCKDEFKRQCQIESRFDISPDEARRLREGRASLRVIEKVQRIGGLSLEIELLLRRYGDAFRQHLATGRQRNDRTNATLAEVARHYRPVHRGYPAGSDSVAPDVGGERPGRRSRVASGHGGQP